jgi:CubicO group peptidase (beta-lactamase class C family)
MISHDPSRNANRVLVTAAMLLGLAAPLDAALPVALPVALPTAPPLPRPASLPVAPAAPSETEASAARVSVEQAARIQALVEEARSNGGLPGVAVALVDADGVLLATAAGFADLERQIPATATTRFRIASLSKVFAATLMIQLRDRGVLGLDDPVAPHLPEGVRLPSDGRGDPAITFRHLAQHTSGLPERPLAFDPDGQYLWGAFDEEALREELAGTTLEAPIGAQVTYSNLGLGMLGLALAGAADTPYDTLLERELLAPLGMERTAVIPYDLLPRSMARGYQPGAPPVRTRPWELGCLAACGDMVSSAEDMARFLTLQLQAGRAGVTPVLGASLREIQRPQRVLADWRSAIGLGWIIDHDAELGEVVRHNGGMGGFTSHMSLSPEHRVAVVVLSNGGLNPAGGSPARDLGRALLRLSITDHGMVAPALEDLASALPASFQAPPPDGLLDIFRPDFLEMFSPEVVEGVFTGEVARRGVCTGLRSVERLDDPWHGAVVLAFEDDSELRCELRLAREPPHGITYLSVR